MRLAVTRPAAAVVLLFLSASLGTAAAQRPEKASRVGYLTAGSHSDQGRQRRFEAFRQGLRELGYVEGQNIAIESRWAEGKDDRYPALAADLVRLKVDVIVAVGGAATKAAQQATRTTPIVMSLVNDPLGSGLVPSLARPGGNVTGISLMAPDLVGKQIEVLKEVVPKVSRVALLRNPVNPASAPQLREAEAAARALGVRVQTFEARVPHEIDSAFAAMTRERAGALVVLTDSIFTNQRRQIAELAVQRRLPAVYGNSEHAEAGGLMAYSANLTSGTPATQAAKQATRTIPIVMTQLADPVGTGLVASLGRPGGNVTGLTTQDADLGGKRLELLLQVVPRVSRLALLIDETNPGSVLIAKGTQAAAASLGLRLQSLGVRDPGELDRAFAAMKEGRAGALMVESSSMLFTWRERLADLALKNRLPSMFAQRQYAEGGGLMAYSADVSDLFRRAATFVDRILKGAKPADLPVEQPTKWEFVVNLKTAKALGLTIPQSLLLQATQVIE